VDTFEVTVKFESLAIPRRDTELALTVDARSTLSWIPRDVLETVGAIPLSRLPFSLSDGRILERDVTAVLLTIDGRTAPVGVAFAEQGEAAVLGATALEGLGLLVDPIGKKLLPRNLLALAFTSPQQS